MDVDNPAVAYPEWYQTAYTYETLEVDSVLLASTSAQLAQYVVPAGKQALVLSAAIQFHCNAAMADYTEMTISYTIEIATVEILLPVRPTNIAAGAPTYALLPSGVLLLEGDSVTVSYANNSASNGGIDGAVHIVEFPL